MAACEALRAAGVKVQMHAGTGEGMGSMKSQFKKADGSGARYALIFGADELAQGCVAVKTCAAKKTRPCRPRRSSRWPMPRPGRTPCAAEAAGPTPCGALVDGLYNHPNSIRAVTGQNKKTFMAKHLDLEEQEQLDELKHFWKQYGDLITWG
jgi:hypothetical protein